MLLRLLAIILLMLLGGGVTGCACPSARRVPGTPCATCTHELAAVDQTPPDLAELVSAESELTPLPSPTDTYRLLDASTCQRHAATNASLANMVELERHWAKVLIECDSKNVRENLCLDRDLLALHAYDLRNSSAASALEAFYQLAGLQAQEHYLLLGINETKKTLSRIDKLRSRGLTLPDGVDRSSVASKLNELEDQTLQLEFLRIQLNGQLQKLTGCPLDEYTFFWPQVDWQVDLSPLNVEEQLAQGLATRSDLRGLSLVLCQLEKQTLPVARGVLGFADATVGTVEPVDGWIHTARCYSCYKNELPIRCRQLAIIYDETQRLATAEIKSAVYKIKLQQQRVVIAQQAVKQLRSRLHELNETRDVDDISIFEISKVRGQLYEAESNLIEQTVALQLASVGLRRAQGLLALECGFEPALCREGRCDGVCSRCQGQTCRKQRGVSCR